MTDILDSKEAALYIKHSLATLEQWRAQNKGPKFYKPEHKIIYFKADLDEWIKGEDKNG